MNISTETDEIFEALAKAQAELVDPHKDNEVNTGSFSYQYADLAGTLKRTRPIMAKYGLAVTQWASTSDGKVGIETLIGHASGQHISALFEVPIPPPGRMNQLQVIGSCISYARRYAYLAAVGLAADDDDGAIGSKDAAELEVEMEAKSADMLEGLTIEAGKMQTLEDLTAWWKAKAVDINAMTLKDRTTLMATCSQEKARIVEAESTN